MTMLQRARGGLMLGYGASLAAAVCYGAGTVVARKIVTDFTSPLVGSAYSLMFGTALVAIVFYRHAVEDLRVAPRRAWLYVALAGGASLGGVSFVFLALDQAPVVLVAPLAGTTPLFSLIFVYAFLRGLERVTLRTVLGALLVVAGVALIALGREV